MAIAVTVGSTKNPSQLEPRHKSTDRPATRHILSVPSNPPRGSETPSDAFVNIVRLSRAKSVAAISSVYYVVLQLIEPVKCVRYGLVVRRNTWQSICNDITDRELIRELVIVYEAQRRHMLFTPRKRLLFADPLFFSENVFPDQGRTRQSNGQ